MKHKHRHHQFTLNNQQLQPKQQKTKHIMHNNNHFNIINRVQTRKHQQLQVKHTQLRLKHQQLHMKYKVTRNQ